MIMVQDAVWYYATRHDHDKWRLSYSGYPCLDTAQISTDNLHYCKECIEKAIGRELTSLDLTDAPVNDWVRDIVPEEEPLHFMDLIRDFP